MGEGAATLVVRDGMTIEYDVGITVSDGTELRADIYRPIEEGRYPVIISYGPYGKLLNFEDGYPGSWRAMVEKNPDVAIGSSNRYQCWEVVDPEKWVPNGYVCVRVDSRGTGRSPGVVDFFSPRETEDFANCIHWAGTQPWSNGKVGANGISYYAMNQWQVAALQPKHLAAICVWEGCFDLYRDWFRHGGIVNTFSSAWFNARINTMQHGAGTRGFRSRMNGEWVSGPETLTSEELASNRVDFPGLAFEHPLDGSFWSERTPDPSLIKVPVLSAGNIGSAGLHLRGNTEGYLSVASKQKWLELHGQEHWTEFYTDYGLGLQRQFFDHFLKGLDNGWDKTPKVRIQVRSRDRFVERHEDNWPVPGTQWTKKRLSPDGCRLVDSEDRSAGRISFKALGDGVTFISDPLTGETEITGPIAVRLNISSSTQDADIFVVVRAFSADLNELVFQGMIDPHTPVAQGWLRASQRKLNEARSLPYRPFHAHDEKQPLTPDEVYRLDIEVWPTSVIIPENFRLAVSVRGRDYIYPSSNSSHVSKGGSGNEFGGYTGCGPFQHDDPRDRPANLFGGVTTLHFGDDKENFILLPIIPKANARQ